MSVVRSRANGEKGVTVESLAFEECVEVLERGLVEWCSPTMAGVKPSNMFNVGRFHQRGTLPCGRPFMLVFPHRLLCDAVEAIVPRLAEAGVRVCAMAERHGSSSVFAYRPDLLSAFIQHDPEATMLEMEGYDVSDVAGCVERVRRRILDFDACPRDAEGFDRYPHEIGFLLGYPLEDVLGFVRNRQAVLLRGHWNVYSDVVRARRIFGLYDACTAANRGRLLAGEPFEGLATVKPLPLSALWALYETTVRAY